MVNIDGIPALASLLRERPLRVVDVGAAGGIQYMWRGPGLARYVRCYGFEPNPVNFAALRDDETTKYFQLAVSNRAGVLPFHALGTVGSLTVRDEREAVFGETFETIEVNVETLANLRHAHTVPQLDVIKSDAEHHDYSVIEGAGQYLDDEVLCVISEFEYCGRRTGSRFRDIDELLTARSFILFGVQHKLGVLGEVFGGDVLYLRDVGSILHSNVGADVKRERLLKLCAIALILDRTSYAYVIASAGEEAGLLSEQQATSIRNAVAGTVFLPWASPINGKKTHWLTRALSVAAQVASGDKWGSKAAPRPGELKPSPQLHVKGTYMPRSWRNRYSRRLSDAFDRYKRLRGIFYE